MLTVWQGALAHRAFGHGLRAHVDAAGLPAPDQIERMRTERLGWD